MSIPVKIIQPIVLVLMAWFLANCSRSTVTQVSPQEVEQMVKARQFKFVATSAIPMRGGIRVLNSPYDVVVKNDTLVSYLPYFGVSRSAPISQQDAGIQFTSQKFNYHYETASKNSWQVNINLEDQSYTNRFYFLIYPDGSATLDVTSNVRDAISFKGYLVRK